MKKTISALLIPTMLGASTGIMTYASKKTEEINSSRHQDYKPRALKSTAEMLKNPLGDQIFIDSMKAWRTTLSKEFGHLATKFKKVVNSAGLELKSSLIDKCPIEIFCRINQVNLETASEHELDRLVEFKKTYLALFGERLQKKHTNNYFKHLQAYESKLEENYYGKTLEEKRRFVSQEMNSSFFEAQPSEPSEEE